MKFIDLTGMTYNNLHVLYKLHNVKGRTKWLCQCKCGTLVEVVGNSLRTGRTKSCGCLRIINHVCRHNKSNTRLYSIWRNMKQRCTNPRNKDFKYYGAQGVVVQLDWLDDFDNFYRWAISSGYSDSLTLDRIDCTGDYSASNCRWVTRLEQSNNRSCNKVYTISGERLTLSEACRKYQIRYTKVYKRLLLGWTIYAALEIGENNSLQDDEPVIQ